MKTKVKAKNKEYGEGHKGRIAVIAKCKTVMDGKISEFNFDYDVTITIEHIDYIVRQIAGRVAKAANNIAENGIGRDLEKERKDDLGVSNPLPI
jgi:formyltetrahydrofolate synthetase